MEIDGSGPSGKLPKGLPKQDRDTMPHVCVPVDSTRNTFKLGSFLGPRITGLYFLGGLSSLDIGGGWHSLFFY